MSPSKKSSSSSPVAVAQSQALATFEKTVRNELKSVLGADGLKRLRTDVAITTSVRGGVIIHSPLRRPPGFDAKRLRRKSEIAAVIVNTVPLIDMVTLNSLEPGAYAWAVRRVRGEIFAFDFFNTRGAPALTTMARNNEPGTDAGTDAGTDPFIDVDITGDGPDSLVPPGEVLICLSLMKWLTCFYITKPTLPWPW